MRLYLSQLDGLSFDAAWFLGAGFAIVLAGFMNAAMLRDGGRDTLIWLMTFVTNSIFLLGFAFATFMTCWPQAIIGTILFAMTFLNSLFARKPVS